MTDGTGDVRKARNRLSFERDIEPILPLVQMPGTYTGG